VLTNSLIKTKLHDPLILSLVKNIGEKRSLLENLCEIVIDSEFSDIVSNQKDAKFYIENQLHKAKGFRKLHVEIAEFSDYLKILHCVFFPDPSFNIPIFGLDLIKVNEKVTGAIVDLSPVSKDELLEVSFLLDKINTEGFSNKRKIPSWGDIFSKNVFFASLKDKEEENAFYQIVDKYLSILIDYSKSISSDDCSDKIKERIYYQKKYCSQQMKNEKTSTVLLKYFDKEWVDKYIKEILFDF